MMNNLRLGSRSLEKRKDYHEKDFDSTSNSLMIGGRSLARALDFRDLKTPIGTS